jgi:mono/diheme cytochrome c family protein
MKGRTACRELAAGLCLAATLVVAGCKATLPPPKPLAELSPAERDGYSVFQSRCAGCHYAGSESSLHGPGLQGIYRKRYLPSGAPANDDRVASVVLHGRGLMPAFGNNLDEQQLGDLLAYLHTL